MTYIPWETVHSGTKNYLILSPNYFLSPSPSKKEGWKFLPLGQMETVELGLYHLTFVSLSGSFKWFSFKPVQIQYLFYYKYEMVT